MTFKNKYVQKFWKFSTSFQLGIPILIAIAILTAAGTIVEAIYNDAGMARRLVYDSWMMWVTMGLLVYNLLAVVIDRLPWKLQHYPFVTVHFGIIILVFGGWVTGKYGVDGTLAIPIGGQSKQVIIPPTDFLVFATYDGDRYAQIFKQEVDFYELEPSEQKPFVVRLEDNLKSGSAGSGSYEMKVIRFHPFARVNKKVVPVPATDPARVSGQLGASIKFQLSNPNVKQIEVLTQDKASRAVQVNLGPLALYLGHDYAKLGRKSKGQNEVYFAAVDSDHVEYTLFKANEEKPFEKKSMKIGSVVQTPWMGLQIQLIDYLQHAREEWDVKPAEASTPLTTAVALLEYKGMKQWMLLNDTVKIFGDTVAFIVSYRNRAIDLGFPIRLVDFKVSRYQGTGKAMEYASTVMIGTKDIEPQFNSGQIVISMNEPMKFAGYTFYQSSFNEDENTGEPVASILSVNKDPGRWIKYLGSLILSIGIIWLFYQRRKRRIAS